MSATGGRFTRDHSANGGNGDGRGNGAHPARNGHGGDDQTRRRQVRRALFAGVVGTSIEWYDFFLYGTAAALVFPQLFFPESSHYAGALASFAIYAVGFAARPVGAAIFGHWGDRIGRKATLIVDAAADGLRERADRPPADLRLDRPRGRRCCSSCCACCRASASAASGAARSL